MTSVTKKTVFPALRRRASSFVAFFPPLLTLALIVFFLGIWASPAQADHDRRTVVVGIYDSEPLLLRDGSGEARGLMVDVLEWIAEREGWELYYHHDTFQKLVAALDQGKIDLLPALARTEERAKQFLFTDQSVVTNWARLYVPQGESLNSLMDIRGRRVGLLASDVYVEAFDKLMRSFDVQYVPVEFSSYSKVMEAVEHREVVCGVVPRTFADRAGGKYMVDPTAIVFSPVDVRIAAPGGADPAVINAINAHLLQIKRDPDSVYNESMQYWFGNPDPGSFVPAWVTRTIAIGCGLLLVLAVWVFTLRGQVSSKTALLRGRNVELEKLVAERRSTEEKLSHSQANYRALVEYSLQPTVIIGWDPFKVLYLNKAMCALFGLDEETALNSEGDSIWQVVHPADRKKVRELYARRISGEAVASRYETRVIATGNKTLWVELSAAPVFYMGAKATQIMLLDVTKRKNVEAALREAKNAAESSSKAKSEFLATMSHELRTPLNGIMGMLQVALLSEGWDSGRKNVESALETSRHLLSVINDILDLSKVEAGKMRMLKEPFSVHDLMASIAGTFESQVLAKGLDFHWAVAPDMPALLVGDSSRLRQILFNLVGNALKFTEKGEIRMEAAYMPAIAGIKGLSNGGGQLLFTVSDTGIGIPGDKIDQVFDTFTQADGSHTRKYQGSGLGLGIVRRLVGLMGGNVNIESQVGVGTTIYFQVEAGGVRDESALQAMRGNTPAESSKRRQDRPLRVLIVEDDVVSRLACKKLTAFLGHEAMAVDSGQAALDALGASTFDCVLMDIQMPGMDGLETVGHIRDPESRHYNPDLVVIALTAHAMQGDRDRFLQAGMSDYLAKPIELELLKEALGRV